MNASHADFPKRPRERFIPKSSRKTFPLRSRNLSRRNQMEADGRGESDATLSNRIFGNSASLWLCG